MGSCATNYKLSFTDKEAVFYKYEQSYTFVPKARYAFDSHRKFIFAIQMCCLWWVDQNQKYIQTCSTVEQGYMAYEKVMNFKVIR